MSWSRTPPSGDGWYWAVGVVEPDVPVAVEVRGDFATFGRDYFPVDMALSIGWMFGDPIGSVPPWPAMEEKK